VPVPVDVGVALPEDVADNEHVGPLDRHEAVELAYDLADPWIHPGGPMKASRRRTRACPGI